MVRRNVFGFMALLVAAGLLLSCAAPPQAEQKGAAPTQQSGPGTTAQPAATPKPATTASTAGQPARGGTFNISFRDEPPSFDPHQGASAMAFYAAVSAPYNGLLTYDVTAHEKLVGDLAKKWEVSPDGKGYTFTLEQGVKWQDGQPFSADDVKASLMRQVNPPQGVVSVSKAVLEPVDSVDVVDPTTVKVNLKRPYAAFPTLMAISYNAILPKHILDTGADMKKEANMVGTGPWKLNSYVRGVSLTWDRNPNYFKAGLPYMDKMVDYIIPEASTRLSAFRAGQVMTDMKDHEPPAIDTIEKEMGDVAIAYRIPGNLVTRNPFIVSSKPPFDDVRLRQAVNLALDRQEYQQVCDPGMYAVGGYMPPGSQWALSPDELSKQPGYATGAAKDAERQQAKKLLADAGYPNGIDIELKHRNTSEFTCEAVYVKADLDKIGMRATIRPEEAATYTDDLAKQNFQIMASGYAYLAPDPDLMFGEAFTKGGGKNWGKFYNADFEKLFAEQSAAVDPAKRKDLVHQINLLLHQQVPFPVVAWTQRTVGVWKKVKGYTPWLSDGRQNQQYRFESTWLDPTPAAKVGVGRDDNDFGSERRS